MMGGVAELLEPHTGFSAARDRVPTGEGTGCPTIGKLDEED